MCNILDGLNTNTTTNCFSPGVTLRGMSEGDLRKRAEKDQKKVKLFEEYTKILGVLTYQEWLDLREEMDRLFKQNLHDIEKTATLQTLREITEK